MAVDPANLAPRFDLTPCSRLTRKKHDACPSPVAACAGKEKPPQAGPAHIQTYIPRCYTTDTQNHAFPCLICPDLLAWGCKSLMPPTLTPTFAVEMYVVHQPKTRTQHLPVHLKACPPAAGCIRRNHHRTARADKTGALSAELVVFDEQRLPARQAADPNQIANVCVSSGLVDQPRP